MTLTYHTNNVSIYVVILTQVGTSDYLGLTHLGTLFQVPVWVRKFSLGSTGDDHLFGISLVSKVTSPNEEHYRTLNYVHTVPYRFLLRFKSCSSTV